MTCSAASFGSSTSSPAGRVPLIGIVTSRRPRRAGSAPATPRRSPSRRPRTAARTSGAQRRQRGGEPGRVARRTAPTGAGRGSPGTRRRARSRPHRLDRLRVAVVVPAALPLADLDPASGRRRPRAGRIRHASSGSRHGSGGAGTAVRRDAAESPNPRYRSATTPLRPQNPSDGEVLLERLERAVRVVQLQHPPSLARRSRAPCGAGTARRARGRPPARARRPSGSGAPPAPGRTATDRSRTPPRRTPSASSASR